MKNKILGLSFLIIVSIALFTIAASAATYGDLKYTVSNGEVTITGCNRNVTSVDIPSEINGYPVTKIGSWAFQTYWLKSITIPDSVTSIGSWAFKGCINLTNIVISDNLEFIGTWAFYETGFYNDEDNWENSVLYIDNYLIEAKKNISGECKVKEGTIIVADSAFDSCTNLTNVIIPNSVTSIGYGAFYNCTSLTSVTIPDSVTSIDYGTFYNCTSLTSINIPDSVESIGEGAFENSGYYNDEGNWENGVLYLDEHLLCAKSTISGTYSVKDGTKSISGDAFSNCENLSEIYIPDSVLIIGGNIFTFCTNLKGIWVNKNNPNYASDENGVLFDTKNKTLIRCPASTTLKSYVIPKGVLTIACYAFENCTSLESITVSESVTRIELFAFQGCENLKEIHITDIASWCRINFSDDYGPTIHDGVDLFLNNKRLTSIVIPEGVTYISDNAFLNCDSIKSIFIPEFVTRIGLSLGFGFLNGSYKPIDGFTIYGYIGSVAESYAMENEITFVSVDQATVDLTLPERSLYVAGDTFDLTGFQAYLVHPDGESVDITNDVALSITKGDILNTVGKHSVNVDYIGKSASFDINVYADYIPGDTDGNCIINLKDVISIRRAIVGGYGVEKTPAFDVDHNGEINLKDVITLRRYIVGGYGVEL